MEWSTLLRAARKSAGLTQAELAARVGTSRSRLSAYEVGAVAPSVTLYERLLAAAGAGLSAVSAAPLSASEAKSLRLHAAIAERVVADPQRAVAKAQANLATMRAADTEGHASRWLDEWEHLLDGPLLDLVNVVVSTSQEGRDLRQSTPFAGVLSPAERLDALRGGPLAS